jgi:hypothetical protein
VRLRSPTVTFDLKSVIVVLAAEATQVAEPESW